MKYIKKPIPIEISEPWWKLGDHPDVKSEAGAKWMRANTSWYRHTPFEKEDGYCLKCHKAVHEHGWIGTLEGGHVVCPGDRIVTGVQGEHYPIKPDIFEQTYEKADGNKPQVDAVAAIIRPLLLHSDWYPQDAHDEVSLRVANQIVSTLSLI